MATTSSNSSFDEMAILQTLNDKKAVLLIPAIAYTVVLMIIGIIGNPLAIFIYAYRWQKTTTKYFLLSLAVMDLINCLITMPTEIAVLRNFYFFDNGAICKISRFSTYVMNNASSVVLLVIAIDRYIRICRPHSQPFSTRGSKIACGVAVLAGVAVSWPALVMYGREEVLIPLPGGTVEGVMCLVENKFDSTPYPFAFFMYLWVAFIIIAIIIIVLYILIGRAILKRKRMKKERKGSSANALKKIRNESASTYSTESGPTSPISPVTPHLPGSSESSNSLLRNRLPTITSMKWSKSKFRPGKSTLMMFAITVVYVLSFLPFLVVGMIRIFIGESFYPLLSRTEQVAVNIFSRSYLVNNCANPLVYGLCNSQFRGEVKKLFQGLCSRETEKGI